MAYKRCVFLAVDMLQEVFDGAAVSSRCITVFSREPLTQEGINCFAGHQLLSHPVEDVI